ncbi:MAG: VCBS repeat-containing protein [Halioglobus sp.]
MGSRAEAVAIGDVNNDGRNDVLLTTSFNLNSENDYKLFVFLQDANGDLAAPLRYPTASSYTARAQSIDIGDIDNDGLNEVVLGIEGEGIEIIEQSPTGLVTPGSFIPTPFSLRVRIADLNNDGLQDVAGIGWGGDEAGVFLQDSSGSLYFAGAYYAPHGGWDDLALGDVNNDELTDIIVMSGQSFADNLAILNQDSTGGFNPVEYYAVGDRILTRGVGVGDVTGDDLADVVVSFGGNKPASHIAIFSQQLDGALGAPIIHDSLDIPAQVEVVDVTGDCHADVVVGHSGWSAFGVYRQDVTGNLLDEQLYPMPNPALSPHAMALGDFNGDQSPDIALAASSIDHGLITIENARAFASADDGTCIPVTPPPGC